MSRTFLYFLFFAENVSMNVTFRSFNGWITILYLCKINCEDHSDKIYRNMVYSTGVVKISQGQGGKAMVAKREQLLALLSSAYRSKRDIPEPFASM